MKTSEIREMAENDLKAKEAELRKELFSLRMRHRTSQLENPLRLRALRKDIAKVLTVMKEKKKGGR